MSSIATRSSSTAPQLSDGARACVAVMDLQTKEQNETVRFVIANHSKPSSGFCSTLSWLLYKIKEAVLSLFGQSNWQEARSLIAKRTMDIAKQYKILSVNSPEINKKTTQSLEKISKRAANDLLKLAVAFNEDPEKFKKQLPNSMRNMALLEPLMPMKIVEKTVDGLLTAAKKARNASTLQSATQ